MCSVCVCVCAYACAKDEVNVLAYAGKDSIQRIMGYESITWSFIPKLLPPVTLRAKSMEDAI